MKKYLITALTSVVVLPAIGNVVNQVNIHKNNDILNLKSKNINQEPSYNTLNWDSIKTQATDAIDNPTKLSMFGKGLGTGIDTLTQAQKQQLKEQTVNTVNDFENKGITNAQQLNTYAKSKNSDFKTYYDNPEKSSKSLKDQINLTFFSANKNLDLNLDGANTYQDAVDALNQQIQSKFSSATTNNQIKVTLSDDKDATKVLFDDSSSSSILSFVNNQISINVTVSINGQKSEEQTLKLSNIQLAQNNDLDTHRLYQSVSAYFSDENSQSLKLSLQDTRQTAFNRALENLKARFPNYDSKFKLTLTNPSAAAQNFFNSDIINDIANKAAWIGVNISPLSSGSKDVSQNLRFYINFDLDFLSMTELINQLYLTGSSSTNTQTLILSTNNTYQDVINQFNQRLLSLNSNQTFSVYLTDASQASTTLETQYDPRNPNKEYAVNVGFQFTDPTTEAPVKIGTTTLYLSNVSPSAQALKLKKNYDQQKDYIDQFTLGQNLFTTATAILTALALGAWVAAAFTEGATTEAALSFTKGAIFAGLMSSVMGLVVYNWNTAIDSAAHTMFTWAKLCGLGLSIASTLTMVGMPALSMLESNWWVWPAIGLIWATGQAVYGWLSYAKALPWQ